MLILCMLVILTVANSTRINVIAGNYYLPFKAKEGRCSFKFVCDSRFCCVSDLPKLSTHGGVVGGLHAHGI